MLTNNERMNQIIYMFSYVADISKEEAWGYIKETVTAKSIEAYNTAILYEQQTENLYDIIEELKKLNSCPKITDRVTIEKITDSMRAIDIYEADKRRETELKILPFQEKDKIKRKSQLNKDKRRYQLKQQNRNRDNERRLKNADSCTGQE